MKFRMIMTSAQAKCERTNSITKAKWNRLLTTVALKISNAGNREGRGCILEKAAY